MSVNLINSNDIDINQTNDDIELNFSAVRQSELSNLASEISNLKNSISGSMIPISWDNTVTEISGVENSIRLNTAERSCLLNFGVNRSTTVAGTFEIGGFDSTYAPANLVIGPAITSISGQGTYACQISIDSSGKININNAGHASSTFRGQIKWYY